MKKLFSLMAILLVSALFLFACGGGSSGGNSGDNGAGASGTQYTVRILPADGVTVSGENSVKVNAGGTAVFEIEITEGYAFQSVSDGVYDAVTGTLTVSDVQDDIRVRISVVKIDVDAESFVYKFHGYVGDTSTAEDGRVEVGSRITVSSEMGNRDFLGWSFGKPLADGETPVSTSKTYAFNVGVGLVSASGAIEIYANYADASVIYYDTNGGVANMDSANLSATKYYTATESGGVVKLEYKSAYYDKVGAASLFYDDGSFTREGYVLREFNTKPDGSGEGYSFGSKFPMNNDYTTLYCIWAEDTAHSDFEYSIVDIALPAGARDVPHWEETGVIITKYKGDAREVVIPEMLGGRYVTAIAAGAFENKYFDTLVLSRRIIKIEDGAFVGCMGLTTIYYPDSIYYIGNAAFDESSWENVKNFYVNATMAPRYNAFEGSGFSLKLVRFLLNEGKNRIAVIAGSSTYQGLSTEYLEALLDGSYTVINFGTTRTTHGTMYLEAMGALANDNDVILYAPENSIYMLGEPRLYWKSIRDLEGMYNIFRYVDISNYENVLGAFSSINRGEQDEEFEVMWADNCRYTRPAIAYEDVINLHTFNEYGEIINSKCDGYVDENNYKNNYEITLNERAKSILEGYFGNANPDEEDPFTSDKWCSITDARYVNVMSRVVDTARSSGALVIFSFAPVDADKLIDEAKADIAEWCNDYDNLILDTYAFDGILGSSLNYIYNHQYFYDNAFHTNYYGRAWRTYTMYTDLAVVLGIDETADYNSVGTDFDGCRFEDVTDNTPLYKVDYIVNGGGSGTAN